MCTIRFRQTGNGYNQFASETGQNTVRTKLLPLPARPPSPLLSSNTYPGLSKAFICSDRESFYSVVEKLEIIHIEMKTIASNFLPYYYTHALMIEMIVPRFSSHARLLQGDDRDGRGVDR